MLSFCSIWVSKTFKIGIDVIEESMQTLIS